MVRLATDVGGTFTDLIAYDETTGQITFGKTLTTTDDQSTGVLNTIFDAKETNNLDPAAIDFFVHGGTTVINAITEWKGVKTALITTRGFRDVLEIGRGNRPDLYNLKARTPPPYIPRRYRLEVTERLDGVGNIITPLDESDVADVADICREADIEAVAVVFLHSYVDDRHEVRCADLLRSFLPGVMVSTSSQISRQWREYERTCTAVLNAYVQPVIDKYFRSLEKKLLKTGLDCPLYAMQSNGGVASFSDVRLQPLTLVESGPSGGIAGAVRIGQAIGAPDVLSLDVGGTTAKCSLIRNGRPQIVPEYKLEWSRFSPGYTVQVPVVDIVEIGAGGGSIASMDQAGHLNVGPESAGSTPGPVCYGRGGISPTITDAMLVTGILNPENFANGKMSLNVTNARAAFQSIADTLNCSVEEASSSVIRITHANMINALKLVTVQRGHDPRDLSLIVSGGAGPMLAAKLGRELNVKSTVIPVYPGVFSAWGMLSALPRTDLRRTLFCEVDNMGLEKIRSEFQNLVVQAANQFNTSDVDALNLHFAVEARYQGQEHSVSVAFQYDDTVQSFIQTFHATHETAYTFKLPESPIEITNLHLQAEHKSDIIALREIPQMEQLPSGAVKSTRDVFFGPGLGWLSCPVYDRALLFAGCQLDGPLLIEEPTTTSLVLPGQVVETTTTGLLIITELG
ncbi:MAG: hydantoinase/oxoprolinase family protein [Sneathiella sp.]|uniref:hydantoinase/oxoprolinase family protein n=1 Tax=Sneathiella sp. TaxID=1964365 RepID=UPI003002E4D1